MAEQKNSVGLIWDLGLLLRETGKFINTEMKGFDQTAVSDKGLNQLVSYVDVEAEKLLVGGLRELLPEAGFITEEDTQQRSDKQLNWVIDPLDGTTNFIHGLPVFCISVALCEGDDIHLGAIFDPNRDELFTAWKGGGANLNGYPIRVSSQKKLSDSLLATGFPYREFEKMPEYLSALSGFMKGTRGLRRMGSAAIDLAYVACGRFDGFFEMGLSPWDIAAGIILVREAGGMTSNFSGEGNGLNDRHILASNSHIYSELLEGVKGLS